MLRALALGYLSYFSGHVIKEGVGHLSRGLSDISHYAIADSLINFLHGIQVRIYRAKSA